MIGSNKDGNAPGRFYLVVANDVYRPMAVQAMADAAARRAMSSGTIPDGTARAEAIVTSADRGMESGSE